MRSFPRYAAWAAGAFLLLSLGSALTAWILARRESEHASDLLRAGAHTVRNELVARLDARFSALIRMSRRWERQPPPRATWEFEARLLYNDFPGFQVIEWVDPNDVVRWLVPEEGNEKARDLRLSFEERRRTALERSKAGREPVLTRPIELVVGGKGFLLFSPLHRSEGFHGFLLGVFRAEKLMQAILAEIPEAARFSVELLDGGERLFAEGGGAGPAVEERIADLERYGARWSLRVRPKEAFLAERRSAWPAGALAVGNVLAALVAMSVYLGGQARVRARRAERAEAELRVALSENEAFSYTIAHDLRAPLRAISGFASLLIEEHIPPADATGRDYARRLDEAGRRMDALVTDLLEYSRLARQDLPVEPLDPRELVQDVVRRLGSLLDSRGARVDVAERMPRVRAHKVSLSQALTNLLDNATKFVPKDREPRVRISAEALGGRTRIWVEDNGIGIAPEHRERIFGLFQRLHVASAYPGTGVGLAIVKKAVERMGGRAGVESEPGRGSRFFLDLPAA